jgi:hypothetical protein
MWPKLWIRKGYCTQYTEGGKWARVGTQGALAIVRRPGVGQVPPIKPVAPPTRANSSKQKLASIGSPLAGNTVNLSTCTEAGHSPVSVNKRTISRQPLATVLRNIYFLHLDGRLERHSTHCRRPGCSPEGSANAHTPWSNVLGRRGGVTCSNPAAWPMYPGTQPGQPGEPIELLPNSSLHLFYPTRSR